MLAFPEVGRGLLRRPVGDEVPRPVVGPREGGLEGRSADGGTDFCPSLSFSLSLSLSALTVSASGDSSSCP